MISIQNFPKWQTIDGLVAWAKAALLPAEFVARLPELARRDLLVVREICDELAELGYPFTANELRAYWRSPKEI